MADDWTGGYRPAIAAPPDFLGLYFEAKKQRQQQDQFRATQEAEAETARLHALNNSIELAFKTGDKNLGIALFDSSTRLGAERDYKAIASAAKAGKQKQATPGPKAQSELATGFANQDPLQAAVGGFRLEEQGVPTDVVEQMKSRGLAIGGEQQRKEAQFREREQFKAGVGLDAFGARQERKSEDTVYSVNDRTTGEDDSIIGLRALREARARNPKLIITGKPTKVGEDVLGTPTKTRYAQLQDDAMHLDQARDDIGEAISMLEENPALAGFVGTATRALGGGWQTLQEMGGMPIAASIEEQADLAANRIAEDIQAGRIDSKVARDFTKALSDPNAAALDVLGAAITYGYARSLRGEGKLTVDDKERAEGAVGIRTGAFTSSAQVAARLKYALKRIERQRLRSQDRLDFNKAKQPTAAAPTGGGAGSKYPLRPEEATLEPLAAPPAGGFDIDLMGGQ